MTGFLVPAHTKVKAVRPGQGVQTLDGSVPGSVTDEQEKGAKHVRQVWYADLGAQECLLPPARSGVPGPAPARRASHRHQPHRC